MILFKKKKKSYGGVGVLEGGSELPIYAGQIISDARLYHPSCLLQQGALDSIHASPPLAGVTV